MLKRSDSYNRCNKGKNELAALAFCVKLPTIGLYYSASTEMASTKILTVDAF